MWLSFLKSMMPDMPSPLLPKTSLIISARASLWRDALESYLKSRPGLEVYSVGENFRELLYGIDPFSQSILLVEADLYNADLPGLLRELHSRCPDLACYVIADTLAQYQAMTGRMYRVVMKSMLHRQLDEILFPEKSEEA